MEGVERTKKGTLSLKSFQSTSSKLPLPHWRYLKAVLLWFALHMAHVRFLPTM
jgi:hypothetical protein